MVTLVEGMGMDGEGDGHWHCWSPPSPLPHKNLSKFENSKEHYYVYIMTFLEHYVFSCSLVKPHNHLAILTRNKVNLECIRNETLVYFSLCILEETCSIKQIFTNFANRTINLQFSSCKINISRFTLFKLLKKSPN